jgi:hypothetical protein
MISVVADDIIIFPKARNRADSSCLLAYVKMEETADQTLRIVLTTSNFELTDEIHLLK